MILILQRGAVPNGSRKGRWQLACPSCGRQVQHLLPRRGEVGRPIYAAAWGRRGEAVGYDGASPIEIEVPGELVNTPDGLPWACRRCRRMPSAASREGKRARAERRLAKREADRQLGHWPDDRRPGESWGETERRQQRAEAALRLLEEHDRKRLARVLRG